MMKYLEKDLYKNWYVDLITWPSIDSKEIITIQPHYSLLSRQGGMGGKEPKILYVIMKKDEEIQHTSHVGELFDTTLCI